MAIFSKPKKSHFGEIACRLTHHYATLLSRKGEKVNERIISGKTEGIYSSR